ncbi:hypothetical protein HXX76_013351 [Chlamydomonas incerta]|uniref:SRCR domain-containing protein n=1 Tax=Chlamydomonas incerta TaxID=51695 RepID=A0A835VSB9_CHLIN|nr:hypothetical protein HXX76_013351 [Chlamydomonas incerta]|eukprot:KAG2425980.1 hypothetical protein HXX76_013351 [Chlamydomonas incerta]
MQSTPNVTDGALRLVVSSNVTAAPGQGVLQLYFGGVWGTLHQDYFDRQEARTACRQLGWTTGTVVQYAPTLYGTVLGPVRHPGLSCELQHDRLIDCPNGNGLGYIYTTLTPDASSFNAIAGVQCRNEPPGTEGALRIYGVNASQGIGTLMIYHNGIWYSGPACEHWMTSLANCSFAWPDLGQYLEEAGGFTQLAGVECRNETDGQQYQLRLWGGPTSNSGLLQVWFNGTWGTVVQNRFNWRAARVACRQLGYANGRPVYNNAFGQPPDLVWLNMGTCTGSEARLVDCDGAYFYPDSNHNQQDVGVVCNNGKYAAAAGPVHPEPAEGALRLVGGPTPGRGQVEIFWNGTWGGVCWDDGFRWEAAVICRQLNYSGGGFFDQPTPGRAGSESRLTQCPTLYGVALAWYDDYCSRPLSVVCSTDTLPPEGSLRLVRPVGGATGSLPALYGSSSSLPANSSYGTLQLLRGSRWGLVAIDGFGWQEARVACRQLGFKTGRAVGGVSYDPGLSLAYWVADLRCAGSEARLVDCPHTAYGSNDRIQWYSTQPDRVAGLICSSDPEPAAHTVRLVDGPGPHAGRLEVYGANADLPTWATVCYPNDWYFNWKTVRVICRQLGYNKGGRAVASAIFGPGVTSPSWLTQPVTRMMRSVCNGTESRLDACAYPAPADLSSLTCYESHSSDVGIWCDTAADAEPPTGTLRLVNGPGPWAGRLEVYSSGLWGAVCSGDFTLQDAQVVCRQLGYTGGRIPLYYYYQFGYGSMVGGWQYLLYNMSCSGSEAAISACPGVASSRAYTSDCTFGYTTHLMCDQQPRGSVTSDFTVVDAGSQAPSRVGTTWLGTMRCPDDSLPSGFTLKLDNPSWESSYFGGGSVDTAGVADLRLHCYQDGALLATLTQPDNPWPWSDDRYGTWSADATCATATVNGSTTVRPYLTGVRLRVQGDVNDTTDSVDALGVTDIEFRCSDNRTITGGGMTNGTWGNWTSCPSGTALCGLSSRARDISWCRGGAGNCDDTAMTGLRIQCCYMPAGFVNAPGRRSVRLAGGTSPLEGRVEMLIDGVWGTVYQDDWDEADALGTEVALQNCTFRGFSPANPVENYGRDYSAGAICRTDPMPNAWGALRLRDDLPLLWATGGKTRRLMGTAAGRLEVFWGGRWGTVNRRDSYVKDDGTAIVACKTLGYRGGRAVPAMDFGSIYDALPVWNRNVMCAGNEASLLDCPSDGWRFYSKGWPDYASGYYDLGVVCSNDTLPAPGALRLRGGAVASEGMLEVYRGNYWRGVGHTSYYYWAWPSTWDLSDAIVACKQLGYKGGLQATRGGECFKANNNTYARWDGYADNQAGVICSNDTLPATGTLRLAGTLPDAPGFGRLEVAYRGMWGSVYGPRWGWPESQVACRSLGYKMAAYWRDEVGYPLNDVPVWLGSVDCRGNETLLSQCRNGTVYGPPPDASDAGAMGQPVWASHRVVLECSNSTPPAPWTLRLTGLLAPYAGRLEVRDPNNYNYMPSAVFGSVEAGMACRTLGYEPLYGNTSHSFYANGLGEPYTGVPVLSFNLSCTGTEYSLWDCSRRTEPYLFYDGAQRGANDPRARHAWTVGVYCKAPPDAPRPPPAPPSPAPSPPAPPPPGPEFRLATAIPSVLPQAGGQLTITGQFDIGGAEGGVVFGCVFLLTDPALGGSGVQRSNATAIRAASGTTLRCDVPAAPTPAASLRLNVSRSPARVGFGSGGVEFLSYATAITYYGPCPADCSGNGLCRLGTCTCQEGWTGGDCATAVPLPRIVAVDGAPAAGGTLRILEGARWTAQPRLVDPLPAATWVLSTEYGSSMTISAATGRVEWSAAVAKGVSGGNATSVVISVIDQTSGRVVSYSFYLLVVPLYSMTDLRLNSTATAGVGGLVPGGRAVFSGRVGYTTNASSVLAASTNGTNTTLPSLVGRPVVVLVRPQLVVGADAAAAGVVVGSGSGFAELGATVGVNGTFTVEWPVPLTAQGAHDVFALHPAATLNASATLNATGSQSFQRYLSGVFVSFISAAVDRSAFTAAGGLDPRYALPTLQLDPGRSSLVDPFANLLGALQDLRALITAVRTRLVYSAGGLAPTLAVNITTLPAPAPLCGANATANATIALSYGLDNVTASGLCGGVANTTSATSPGASRLGLRVQTNSSGATSAAEFEVAIDLRGGVSGAATKLLLRVLVDTARVELVTDPPGGRLAAVLPPGGATVVRLAVVNNGNVPSASLLLPANGSWLTCLTPLPLPPLNPGATALVDFRFAVPPGAQLGNVYSASTDVRGGDGRGTAPLRFELAVASEPTGSLEVTVVDEYTTYDPAAPKVADARLALRGQDGRVVAEGRTNSSGVWLFPNLTAGYTYSVDAFSANHTSTTRTVTITGGLRLLRVFMSRVAVKATFAVVPTSFQEEVQFIVNVEYVTFVPMPVVRIEPPLLFIEDLQVGSTHTLRVINTGLVAAFNTRLRIPADSPDFTIAFMRAYWVQSDNVTRANDTADVMVYPYGPASEAAWAGGGADGTGGPTVGGGSRRRRLGGIAAPPQPFITPADYLPMTLVVGRMPAMSELVIELGVQQKQTTYTLLALSSGRRRRQLQGGGGCGWSTNIQLSFSDPCDPSKSNVAGGVSITSRNPPGPQCTAGCCAGGHISVVDVGGGGGGGGVNPWFSFSYESPPTPDLCDKCAADMLEIGLCLGKDLVAPWNKPLSNALEVLGEVYDVIKEVAPSVTVTSGRRLLAEEAEPEEPSSGLGAAALPAVGADSILKDKVVGKIPVLGCLLNPALDCAGFWDAVENKVDNLLGSVGGAPGAMRRRSLLRQVSGREPSYTGGADGSSHDHHVYGTRMAADASAMLAATASGPDGEGAGGGGSGGLGCARPQGRRRQLGGNVYIGPVKTFSPILATAPGKAIIRWSAAIIAMHAAAAEMWGLEHYMSWLNPGYPKDVNVAWTAAWEAATSDGSAAGVLVDWAGEAPALLSDAFTPLVPVPAREALLARWNATYDPAWAAGVSAAGAPPPAPIDLDLVRAGQVLYLNETRAALEAGFTSVFDALDQAIMSLVVVHVTAASSGAGTGEATCARVVVQISQRLVLTRQAFEASLELDNAGSVYTLTNVSVSLTAWLKDNGTEVAAAFAIGQPVVEGMTPDPAVPGAWVLVGGAVATVRWLLVPREAAALAADTWYFIGGMVSYVPGAGLPLELLPLEPADVRVSPEGRLAVRYYIEKDVQGDNPFTPNVVEPSPPATLATLLLNVGRGPSLGLVMDSLQPAIVENEKGLLVGFNITSVAVNGARQAEALRAVIGDVPAGGSALVTWELTCTLQGTFSGINATFVARNPLNDPTLSSIASLDLYDMTHLAWITGVAWDDGLPDMLVVGVSNTTNSVGNLTAAALMNASVPLPTQLHSSRDGTVFPVQPVPTAALLSSAVQAAAPPPGYGGAWQRLTLRVRGSALQPPALLQSPAGSSAAGWQYLRLDTPTELRPSTAWVLKEATAAVNGSVPNANNVVTTQIKLPYNAWTSYRAYSDPAKAKDYIHVLYDGTAVTRTARSATYAAPAAVTPKSGSTQSRAAFAAAT